MNRLFGKYHRVHMIGVGGAGMEGLARVLAAKGCRVSGSDRVESKELALLRSEGFTVYVGHDGSQIEGVDLVVYSAECRLTTPSGARR